MRNKLSVVLMTAFLFGMFLSASLVYAADNLHPKTTFHPDRAPRFMIPYEKTNGMSVQTKGNIPLNLKAGPPTNSPGNVAGLTTYDYQHNGSMGRQVATNKDNGFVFIVWMAQDDFTIPGARGVYVQAYDSWAAEPTYVLDEGGYAATDPDYCGYTSCAWSADGEAAFGCHVDPGTGIYQATYYWDGYPSVPAFIFYNYACSPDAEADWYQPETIWPIISTHNSDHPSVTEDVIYMITHVFEGSEDMILYRKMGTADWDQGQYIETVTDLAYTVVPDANSDKVAIVYTDDRPGEEEGSGSQTDLDVYYILSTDQGDNWNLPVCVSNYSEEDDSLWRAYSDLSAVFTTQDNSIHIIAPVRELRSQSSYENYKSRLVHWAVELTSETVSTGSIIDEARYVMQLTPTRPCDPDAWNLYIAKPSVSYCDGNLYALYTKFGDDNEPGALADCSQAGFANGELYLGASDDMGVTWDTAWNLTKTRTSNCDSSYCESDHWSSMGRYGMVYGDETVDDTLDIMYINDKDAGGIPQGSGTWCVNNVMHYRFPCRDVAHIPKLSLEPTQFIDPTHTPPGVPLVVSLKISNIGNEILNIASIAVSDSAGADPSWISMGGHMAAINTSSFDVVDITLNAGGVLTTEGTSYDATITITHDAPSSPDVVEIALTVASDFNMPEDSILNTTCKQLAVYNTARLGGDTDGASLDIPDDCDSVDTPPNELMYLYDASPMITWNNGDENLAYTTVFTQDFTEVGTFRPQSGLIRTTVPGDYEMLQCTVTTSDSLYGVAISMYAPIDGINCFVVGKYTFFNWNPVKDASEVYLGFVLDWDIPADEAVDNGTGFDADTLRNTIWQYGAEYDTIPGEEDNYDACGGAPINENDRLGGVALFKGTETGTPLNAWTEENAEYQLGSGYDKEYLYTQMTTLSGYNPAALDTIDLHSGMTFEAVDMTAKAEYTYVIGLITTNEGEEDYLDQVDQARAWALAQEIFVDFVCDCVPGDANGDGSVNVGDAVYTISYVFKGGPAPTPYATCSGDGNGDCSCNVGDAVYTISYVFKGGPPPVDCDTWEGACGQPIFK